MNARQEWLLARWDEMCRDPDLARLPHKVELTADGKIELTPPAPPVHGTTQLRIGTLMQTTLGGEASVECPVLTDIGVRVPDAVWVRAERASDLHGRRALTIAPDICVEVLSDTNTEAEMRAKTRAYLAAGAQEVLWVDPDARRVRIFRDSGEVDASGFGLRFETLFGPL